MIVFSYPKTTIEFLISLEDNKLDRHIHYISELHNSQNDYYYKDSSNCQILALSALLTNKNAFNIMKNKQNVIYLMNLLFDLVSLKERRDKTF